MSGISTDVEEQPANSSDSRMIAIAMNIINTWWYPIAGMNLLHPVANLTFAISCHGLGRAVVYSGRPGDGAFSGRSARGGSENVRGMWIGTR